jgi:hypothetical protein
VQDYDRGFKAAAHVSGRQLARLANLSCTHWAPVVSEVQMSERFADRAFTARRGRERFAVYFEAYTTWDDDARWNMLAKSGLLSERERAPTKCLVFILLPEGYRRQGGEIRLTVGGKMTQALSFEEVCLWEKEPEPWWEEAPGLMTLYPLTRHSEGPEDAVRHAAGVIEGRVSDSVRRAELLTVLGIFGTLAQPDIHPFDIIGRHRMQHSPFYQQIKAEGHDEGRKETTRALTLAALAEHLGADAAAQVADRVNAVEDLAELDRLFRVALRCNEIDEFRQALEPAAPRRAAPRPRRSPRRR